MKRERRHQLEQNVLATYLGAVIARIRPALPYVGAAVAILVVGSLIYAIYTASRTRSSSVAWADFYARLAENDASSFEDMADMFPNTPAGRWARLRAADLNLRQGVELMFSNRTAAVEQIEAAIADYEKVEQTARNPKLRAFAQFGLAKAHEALGNIEEAKSYYEQVAKSDLPAAIVRYATERLAFLNSPDGREFYVWLKEHQPEQQPPLELPQMTAPTSGEPTLQFSPPSGQDGADQSSMPLDSSLLPPLPSGGTQGSGDSDTTPSVDASSGPAAPDAAGEEKNDTAAGGNAANGTEQASEESSSGEASSDASTSAPDATP